MAITEAEYEQLKQNLAAAKKRIDGPMVEKKKPLKYRNTPVNDTTFGRFDSQGEFRRWLDLWQQQKAGQIQDLHRQVSFPALASIDVITPDGTMICIKEISWRIDFTYSENGHQVAEDFKSSATETSRFKLQKQAFELKFPEWVLRISDATWLR